MLTSETKVEVFPTMVEYRTPSGLGVRVIRVITTTGSINPRIIGYTEVFRSQGLETLPMGLSLEDILFHFEDALKRQGLLPLERRQEPPTGT